MLPNWPRLTHIALQVADLQACIEFYKSFCDLTVIHERSDNPDKPVVWMAEPGRESDFIMVLMGGGAIVSNQGFSHLGFAVTSSHEVDRLAAKAKAANCLLWPPRQEPYPVGYYCGVLDPNGNQVEFSFGQPLGPGVEPINKGRT